jgi:hypothetical protein
MDSNGDSLVRRKKRLCRPSGNHPVDPFHSALETCTGVRACINSPSAVARRTANTVTLGLGAANEVGFQAAPSTAVCAFLPDPEAA